MYVCMCIYIQEITEQFRRVIVSMLSEMDIFE